MSRFLMCPNSCASTLLTWSGGRCCSNPSVTATAACCGLRPVANAFGCSDGMVYSRGAGTWARHARSCTIASSSGIMPGTTGWARPAFSANLSENQ